MISIEKRINLIKATNPAVGDVQVFLERLLVEVIASNYRAFLNEKLALLRDQCTEPEYACWPPLFANERQVSGVFANALTTMCPSTVAEHKIRRRLERREDELVGTSGRVDFLTSFGQRSIALELKRVPISTTEQGNYSVLKSRWADVCQQSKDAHTFMRQRELRLDYPNGIGVGLMVVRVSKQISSKAVVQDEIKSQAENAGKIGNELQKLIKADFFASYIPPEEMQAVSGFGKNSDAIKIFPTLYFAAVVHGKSESL
jgi:hypothetical protein